MFLSPYWRVIYITRHEELCPSRRESGGMRVGADPVKRVGLGQGHFQHAMVKPRCRSGRIDLDRQVKNANDFLFSRVVPILCRHVVPRGSTLSSEDGEAAWLDADFDRTLFEERG